MIHDLSNFYRLAIQKQSMMNMAQVFAEQILSSRETIEMLYMIQRKSSWHSCCISMSHTSMWYMMLILLHYATVTNFLYHVCCISIWIWYHYSSHCSLGWGWIDYKKIRNPVIFFLYFPNSQHLLWQVHRYTWMEICEIGMPFTVCSMVCPHNPYTEK